MKKINWIKVLKTAGIITLVAGTLAVFIYFTLAALLIFVVTGGLIIPKWLDHETWKK